MSAPTDQTDPDTLVVLSKSERRRLWKLKALPTYGETPAETQARRTRLIKQLALDAGFSRVGIARAEPLNEELARLQAWLGAGMHGSMAWMADDAARRCDPARVVAGAQSVIALALDYDCAVPRTAAFDLQGESRGWISRYAWGDDYHLVAEKRLRALELAVTQALKPELGEQFRGPGGPALPFKAVRDFRWYVDHGPVMERAWAQRAGLGWQGKHSLLVDPQRGSFFFLACVVTSIGLDADAPQTDHCGSCRACVDACPTGAILDGRRVDARLCLSHATIEVDGPVPEPMRDRLAHHLFGCDLCQDACPFNRFSQPSAVAEFAPHPERVAPKLADVLALTEQTGQAWLARSAMKRRGLPGLQDAARAVQSGRQPATFSRAQTDET